MTTPGLTTQRRQAASMLSHNWSRPLLQLTSPAFRLYKGLGKRSRHGECICSGGQTISAACTPSTPSTDVHILGQKWSLPLLQLTNSPFRSYKGLGKLPRAGEHGCGGGNTVCAARTYCLQSPVCDGSTYGLAATANALAVPRPLTQAFI
jgi:hypothetical protein